jgi:alpha-1,2-mannosyltransferase
VSIQSRYRIAALLAAAVVVITVAATAGFVDLQVYRFAWQALVSGDDVYGALPATSAGDSLPYIYPPFAAIGMAPVLVLPWPVAATAALLLSVVALAVTLYAFLGARSLVIIALPLALVAEPVRETLAFGQINIWLMALVAADCLLPKTRWPRGALLGLAAAIKVTPAAFLLFFLVRKDFRSIATALATAATATGLGFLLAPHDSMRYFVAEPFHSGGFANAPFVTNQSISAELSRLGLPHTASTLVFGVFAAAVLAAAVPVMRRVDAPVAMVVNAAAALLLAPISWSHHWVWAVPALALLGVHAWRTGNRRLWFATGAGGVLLLVGPHLGVPTGGGAELTWAPAQHLLGNNYLLTSIALLGYAAWTVTRQRERELVRV